MFSNLINRFVPNVLLPRRYRTEQMVRTLFNKISGEQIDEWFALKKMNDRQIASYFDVIDERLGDKITSYDMDVVVAATTEAVEALIEI